MQVILGLNFVFLGFQMDKRLHKTLALIVDSDLSSREWYLLSLIHHNDGLALVDLLPKQKMPKSTVGRLANRLINLGLVNNNPDVEDYRRQRLNLTPKGREMLATLGVSLSDI